MMGIGLHCLLTEVPLSSLLHHYSRNVHWTVDSDRCRSDLYYHLGYYLKSCSVSHPNTVEMIHPMSFSVHSLLM